jgi:hypothetical protein
MEVAAVTMLVFVLNNGNACFSEKSVPSCSVTCRVEEPNCTAGYLAMPLFNNPVVSFLSLQTVTA